MVETHMAGKNEQSARLWGTYSAIMRNFQCKFKRAHDEATVLVKSLVLIRTESSRLRAEEQRKIPVTAQSKITLNVAIAICLLLQKKWKKHTFMYYCCKYYNTIRPHLQTVVSGPKLLWFEALPPVVVKITLRLRESFPKIKESCTVV